MDSDNYAHLKDRQKLPKILQEMLKLEGTKETQGPANNPVIMQWAAEVGVKRMGVPYTDDSAQPWCGLAMSISCLRAGYEPPPICIRAAAWAEWGKPSAVPMVGDVLVFSRKGGGHVGLYIAEDDTHYHVLGGNQDDEVCIKRIKKKALSNCRRSPWAFGKPWSVQVVKVTPGGIADSDSLA